MGIELIREYLKILQLRYQNSTKSEKTKILDEYCLNTGANRKYVIRLLKAGHKKTRKRPGVIETDTVAHCGGSLLGQFIWSLTFTDVFSGWTENRAIWSKKAEGVVAAIKDIEENLFFSIEACNVDNGSEFLNRNPKSTSKSAPLISVNDTGVQQ